MKILHTADLHLFSPLSANLNPHKAKIRRNEIFRTFERMTEFAEENRIRAFLISGDLFDNGTVGKSMIEDVEKTIASKPQISFFYLKGNHDQALAFQSKPDNLTVFENGFSSVSIEDVTIGGTDRTDFCDVSFRENRKNILMLHGDVKKDIELSKLKGMAIDYIALGHIHSFSEGRLDERTRYAYPGCPDSRGYDECGEKGVVVLETSYTGIKTSFHIFSSRIIEEIRVDVSDCGTTAEALKRCDEQLRFKAEDMMIKLVLCGKLNAENTINAEVIEEAYRKRFFDFKLMNCTSLAFNMHDYIKDDTLKGEFIRIVASSDKYSDEDKLKIAEVGLSALSGEDIW